MEIMGFFDDVPEPGPIEIDDPSPRAVWEKPECMLGGALNVAIVLARTDDAAVCLSGFMAYPNGFEFTLTILLRDPDPGASMRPNHRAELLQGQPVPDDFLRFGLQFSDGQTATNLDMTAYGHDEVPPVPVLMSAGGGGSDLRYDLQQWVWPLPPSGSLNFVCEWPAQHIEESRVEIDAEQIRDASTRAVQLWPERGD